MPVTPTYEELEQRIQHLESHYRDMEHKMRVIVDRYRLATSAAKVGVWDWNIETGDFYLDPNIKAILGYTDDEIPNDLELWVKYVHPEDSAAVMEAAQDCLDGKTPEYVFEHRMLHKDGTIRWVLVRGKTIRDEDGNAVRLVGTDADITERKLVEEALKESEKRYRAIFNNVGDAIYEISLDRKIISLNPAFEKITGWAAEDWVGKQATPLIHPQDLPAANSQIQKFVSGKNVGATEMRILTRAGEERTVEFMPTPVIEDDEVMGVLGIARDITERKRAERALRKAHDELEQRVEERTSELKRQRNHLEELNAALKVLLDNREEDKKLMQERVLSNVKKLIMPYLENLKSSHLNKNQTTYVDVLEANLKEIISPFSLKLSSEIFGLTPAELGIADLIKQGKGTKEIAEMKHLSPKTVARHRESIRKKLGINNRKINLQTHLNSLG